jgi:DNA mismatch repair protein MutL
MAKRKNAAPMNRIRLLPEQVANQIAAGEVIERPASVVKELVENALDAGASRIIVEVQAGGRSLVRVTDDGSGMNRDDALLCLERHATSKIRRAEDLAAIQTMGFRGEALPSIASVSRFTLTTRERENPSPEGTQILIHGGKIIEVKAAGAAPGTSVEVRQIFFNLPARRKFLRSEETERAHIQHWLTLAALAHPKVAFTLLHDGRMIWQLPAVKQNLGSATRIAALQERWHALGAGESQLLPVDFSGDYQILLQEAPGIELRRQSVPVRVWGLIGAPGASRSTREDQHLFVNSRPIENRGLNAALIEGYHTALMKGRYPVCCLFLEMDAAEVDVNIHPAKREVKFHRERDVRRLVTQAVRERLLSFHTETPTTTANPPRLPAEALWMDRYPIAVASRPADASKAGAQEPLPELVRPPAPPPFRNPGEEPESAATIPTQPPLPIGFAPLPSPAPISSTTTPAPILALPLRLVGVIGRLYVVFESDRGMVLMDQHAAHERILFEQMLSRLEKQSDCPSQRLLLAETVELPARDAQFIRQNLATLTRLGVGICEFGERTFLIDALPPFVKARDTRRFALELVDELMATGESVNTLRLGEQVVAKTVCRHAVKANDPLAGPELENLVEDLRRCAMPYTCPHGRPTLIALSLRDLEKRFGRSQ